MQHRRVRTDNFETTSNVINVTGRSGYEQSTDIWLTQDYDVKFGQSTLDTVDPGWNVINNEGQPAYGIRNFERYHIANDVVYHEIDLEQGSLCNAIENLKIKPVGCKTHYNAYPKIQRKLLPYLSRTDTRKNVEFQKIKHQQNLGDIDETGVMPEEHFWNIIRHASNSVVVTIRENAQNLITGVPPALNQFSVLEVGHVSANYVEFGTCANPDNANTFNQFAHPHQIPIRYDPLNDELSFNSAHDVCVRINTLAIGGVQNTWSVFRIGADDPENVDNKNDVWTMKFDQNGIAGRNTMRFGWENEYDGIQNTPFGIKTRTDTIVYAYEANVVNEFYKIQLWSLAHPEKLIIQNSAPIVLNNANNSIAIWLPIPRYSRGQHLNYMATPDLTRLVYWHHKLIDPATVFPHPFSLDSELPFFSELAYAHQDAVYNRQIGTFHPQWALNTVVNGVWSRWIEEWRLHITDINMYTFLRDVAPANHAIPLKLRLRRILTKPFSNIAQRQQGGYVPGHVAAGTTRFIWIVFRKNNITFHDGTQEIRLNRNTLNAAGERPQVSHVYSLQDLNTGWMLPNALGRSLIGHKNLSPFALGGNFFTNQGNPAPNDYTGASRCLFAQDNGVNPQFDFHQVLDPANNNDVGADTLWAYLNDMFSGEILAPEPILLDRTTVLCTKDHYQTKFREPLFGLDSGMSTYEIQYIYYPPAWYSILLQDFFYNFSETDMQTLKNTMTSNIYDNRGAIPVDPTLIATKKTLTIRSRDSLDQKLKELTRADHKYALLTPYKSVVNGSNTTTISIYSERGVPDFIFIFADRKVTSSILGNPIISSVEFFGRTNKNKTLCGYLVDKHELWHATRRNSNMATDMDVLYRVGGVLLARADLGTLERDEYESKDCFDYDVKIEFENETIDATLLAHDVTVTLVTIYHNALSLVGPSGRMTFAEERDY